MKPETSPEHEAHPRPESISHERRTGPLKKNILTPIRIVFIAAIALAVVMGLALPWVPFAVQFSMIGIFPALVGMLAIVLNPFLGLCGFYIYDFLRPADFFPVLRFLKVPWLIEGATLLAWIIHMIALKTKIRWSTMHWLYLAFVGFVGVTIPFAVNNRFAYNVFMTLLIWYLMFVIGSNLLNNVKRIDRFVIILILVHVFYGVKGIMYKGLVGGSLMGDENDLAMALNVFIPFVWFYMTSTKSMLTKVIMLLFMVALVLGVVASLSRGGTVGLLAVMLYCIMRSKRRLIGFGILGLIGLMVVAFAPDAYWKDVKTIGDTHESTAQSRLRYWTAAVRMAADHPIMGVGADNGGVHMPNYVGGFRSNRQWGRTFHGTLPQVIAELGLTGLALYLTMIAWIIGRLWRVCNRKYVEYESKIRALANGTIGGVIGFMVTATFLSAAYYPQLWTLVLIGAAIVMVAERTDTPVEREQSGQLQPEAAV